MWLIYGFGGYFKVRCGNGFVFRNIDLRPCFEINGKDKEELTALLKQIEGKRARRIKRAVLLHHQMENMEEKSNGVYLGATILKSRRLKRKSEEGAVANSSINLTSPESERLSPKLRKYSRILPPNESENQAGEINCKKNAVQSTYTTKTHSRCKERKKPLVPRLYNLNEDGESSNCATGFIHSPQAERPFQCNLCNKQFKYFSNLKSHMKIVHKKMVESCAEDSNSFIVGNGQVFQCEICFRNFKYFSNLRTHQLVHTSNDPDST